MSMPCDEEKHMNFGEWLQQERLQRNLDLRAFAGRVGIDISTVSRIENMRTH
jgi:transcriptional regulator with XRE-family HTH domain